MLCLFNLGFNFLLVTVRESSFEVMFVNDCTRVNIFGYFFLVNQSVGNLVIVISYLKTIKYLLCSFRIVI